MLLQRTVLKATASKCIRRYSQENPFTKTIKVISKDIPNFFGQKPVVDYPEHVDIVIIGGGFIGSSVAYWLKTRAAHGLSVVVLEKDLSYKNSQSNMSLGVISKHFSLPENILLSQFTTEFLRNSKENLGCNVDINFQPSGYLVLASDKYAKKLEENVTVQKEYGVRNNVLLPDDIKLNFPWIKTDDVALGCLSLEAEGTFCTWSFLKGLVTKSKELGTIYVESEVIGFELEKQRDVLMEGIAPGSFERINKVKYRTPDGEERSIKFAACVLAAGHESGEIAKLANIGTGELLLKIPIPVEKRENHIYSFENTELKTGLNVPYIMDTSGLWIKKNGLSDSFICGHVPSLKTPKWTDEEFYTDMIRPSIFNRIHSCNNFEIKKITTEIQDCNSYDGSGLIGPHAYHNNLYLATGFGREGVMHSPGIGRAIAESIIDSYYKSIDLTRFGFDRIVTLQPLVESNMY